MPNTIESWMIDTPAVMTERRLLEFIIIFDLSVMRIVGFVMRTRLCRPEGMLLVPVLGGRYMLQVLVHE